VSLYRVVAAVIEEHGPIRLDHLAEKLPQYTSQQVADAAGNAATKGMVHCVKRVHVPGGTWAGIWAAGPKPDPESDEPSMLPRGDYGIPKVASVWELASA
jgi:hypothetical protein